MMRSQASLEIGRRMSDSFFSFTMKHVKVIYFFNLFLGKSVQNESGNDNVESITVVDSFSWWWVVPTI
jgi:hypothetical protein